MDIAEVEQILRQSAGVVLADPRLVRRVIKKHRGVSGMVPHGRCYAIGREALSEIVHSDELSTKRLADYVILVARPSPRELAGRDRREILTRIWRSVFHARVHLTLQKKMAAGDLEETDVRRRIDRIGQTEFDEVRAILRHDDLVMPPADDRETYIEFAALYLELRHFAPSLLVTTFPGLTEHDAVREILAQDVDIKPLLDEGKPRDVEPPASTRQLKGTSMPSFSAPATFGLESSANQVSKRAHRRLMKRAAKARDSGNAVRAVLLLSRAARVADDDMRRAAEKAQRESLKAFGERLNEALRGVDKNRERLPDWASLLRIVADRATEDRVLRYAIESRLLYELQHAVSAWERIEGTVDVASWLLTAGKKKVIRRLPATRELRVARHLRAAEDKIRHVRVGGPDRKLLSKLLAWATERAEKNMRVALKPRVDQVLDDVELLAASSPEQLARDKIVEELLDRIVDSGYLSFDSVRDAVSRNMLKLDDLDDVRELWSGDTLLAIDAALSHALDGIYRRGDIYLRGLQKASSVPFGTRIGRGVTLLLVLPLGASFVLLEGVGHMVHLVTDGFGWPAVTVLTGTSFLITAGLIFALIHSAPFRAFSRQVFELTALVLATLFLRAPRMLVRQPLVRRWLARPAVRFMLRRVALPGLLAGAVYAFSPLSERGVWVPLAIAGGVFFGGSLLMGSRVGGWLEDFLFDQVAPTWHVLSRQWLPGMFRLITRFFAALMDLLSRGMYGVDELLRFREGQNAVVLFVTGVVGFVWSIIAYVIRLYITLLVEPMVNPLKHFPTVTVADKLMLPLFPVMIDVLSTWLAPLGTVVAGAFATVTVFLIPSVFGFLAWELKENYKLYRATRPERMPPAPVGPNGETMRSLLVVGLHSGTLPKLYERMRRAAQREDDAGVLSLRKPKMGEHRPSGGLGKFRAGIQRVEQGVRRLVERELLALLERCPRWKTGDVTLERIDLSSNRIRIQLACEELGDPCAITIEEQSGYVVAGVAEAGFTAQLDVIEELLFENALAGFYQRAEVDLVREQIVAELGPTAHYDITDEGLIVWPGREYHTELLYRIDDNQHSLVPEVRGTVRPEVPPRVLDTRRMFFRDQAISWLAWVAAWGAAEHDDAEVPRLLRGVSLLPRAT